MAQEMIQAIRQAEISAEQIEKSAVLESESVIRQAHIEADAIIASMTDESKKKADAAIAQARLEGETMMKEALEGIAQEIEVLKSSSKANESEAIKLILSEIL